MQIARGLVYSINFFHHRIDGYTLLTGIAADGTTEDYLLPIVQSGANSTRLYPFVWRQQLYIVEILSHLIAIYAVLPSCELTIIIVGEFIVHHGLVLSVNAGDGELDRRRAHLGRFASITLYGRIMPFVNVGSDDRLCFRMQDDGLLFINMATMEIEYAAGKATLDTFPIGSVYDNVRRAHYFIAAGSCYSRSLELSRGVYKVEAATLSAELYSICACDGILAIEDIDNDCIIIYNIDDGSKREVPMLDGAHDCTACRLSFMRPNLLIVVYDGMRGDEGVSIMSYIDLITGDTYAVDIIATRDDELVCAGLYIAD